MKRALIVCFLLLFVSCDSDKSPLNATAPGVIQIVMSTERDGGTAAHKTSGDVGKTAAATALDNLEVRVLKSDNSVLASKVFTPTDGVFNVTMAVEALDNLKVLCIGTIGGVVEHFGINEDVDVKPGKTTVVIIYGWYEPFRPEIGSIKPNPSQDGAYTVSWTQPPNTTTYILQEADNDKFSGVATVYSGADLQTGVSGKTSGAYYYRVQASNQYLVKSGWSAISSEVVSISQRKYTISGTVTGADGVLVTLSGDASDSVRVDAGGTYTFTVNEKGSYTVTASKAGFLFTPANKTFSAVSSNQVQNFSATQITRTISGVITGADGVLVTLSGDAVGNQVVNNGGTYSFTVPEGGNYTVTPSKEGCAFTPSVGVFTNVRANVTQDFAAALNRATISGTVTGSDSVMVTLSGDASEVQTVNDGGTYTFTVPQGKNITVTPSKTGYVFTPESKTFSGVTINQKQNFTASRIMRTISGTVSGASGVTVSLSGGASDSRVVSVDGGSYSFSVPDGGSYTVTAIKSGYTLSPASKTFTGIAADQTLNFTATRITHTISGTVTGADGVLVTLSGDASDAKTVNSGGSYSFTVGEGGSYTVTPSKAGYVFTPASRIFTNVTADQALNFTAQAQVIATPDVKMVSIPGGTFQMGDVENSGESDEKPVHKVTLSGFEMSVYEITNAQYAQFLNDAKASGDINPSSSSVTGAKGAYSGQEYINFSEYYDTNNECWISYSNSAFKVTSGKENWPVVSVTWYGAKAFSLYYGYDLPTEAEWEYACRGGKQYKYGTDDGTISTSKVSYWDNGLYHSVAVGSYAKNPFGLYDMSGNVWEWCNDWYGTYSSGSLSNPSGAQTGSNRVVRGGSWGNYDYFCRSANRDIYSPADRHNSVGFRVVRRENPQITAHYTISGTITGADSVSVTLSGDASATQIVNSGGSYSFTVGEGGSYTVTPSKFGYVFTPASRTFTNVTDDQALNFTAQAQVIPTTDLKMVSIPSGTFQMGDVEGGGGSEEKPVHTVTVSGFEMSVYEITNYQYAQFLKEALKTGDITATSSSVNGAKGVYNGQEYIYLAGNWSVWPDARCWITYSNNTLSVVAGHENWPVVWVTWYGAKAFALYYGLDLPTESEWEYACRGGKQYKYGTDDGTLSTSKANYRYTEIKHPVAVGSYPKNPFGLYEMSGNVWEWCHDWYGTYPSEILNNPSGSQSGSDRVGRGSCFNGNDYDIRSARRAGFSPSPSNWPSALGFRVVRRASPKNY